MTAGEACALLADMTRQFCAARAERDELRMWLRAALRVLVDQSAALDAAREQLRRERSQHRDLRETILIANDSEAA